MRPGNCRSPLSTIAPRCIYKATLSRQYPFHAAVPVAIALLLVIMAIPPVSGLTLDQHILGRTSDSDPGIDPTSEFTSDDIVVSEVHLKDAREGDRIEWVYTGPQGTTWNKSQTLNPGQSTAARATLDLDLFPLRESVGSWTVDLFLNGEPQDRMTFTVEPLTGFTWWGPFLGGFLLVLCVLGVVVVLLVCKKKKAL
jgi:hypothetical protein